ncbi:TPA: helix-turn-helix domain-containing protein [Legionella pneumophila]|uniref:Helix-turn-helix domain-containing protein n=1 Tax=Legionella pneumophila TaxID=446 RepID=A0AAP3HAQ0_LEGPN|nr:S24 family peptidase [Legionella pneumophila]HAT8842570.1 helix-turn-helix domain-containing protein [Legionella pneumophila subsp. pneumophila]MCZ4690005.1 helix-turn-helix domain-containing protein [Legionella pneumophila]MCZ4709199.1 helix-turn-helix domain-containing protein [Legionella pneumophila]MCZ4717939.1 helix-turn-helix domain-containing protein [Legionella pneumophila]MCZ4761832.1 helix-turn-helix domain-containing protein [Legionella pneumophila]
MTELNIKKEIGKRILEARKAKGLTLKALGELAGGLKQTRLTNWEQGVRTPGPKEIKSLARALDVSPAYLMCLSDELQFKEAKNPSQLIPLLDYRQACEATLHTGAESSGDKVFISVSTSLQPELSTDAFALKITDDSMMPEIRINDVLVIEPSVLPEPGDFVAVKINGKPETIICQYKKLSYTSSEFELLTLNDNWPNIKVSDDINVKIIGVLVQNLRCYKSPKVKS